MAQYFTVTLRAASGRAGIRSLRAFLKIAWRHLNMRAVSVREIEFSMCQRRTRSRGQVQGGAAHPHKGVRVMDVRAFRKPRFLKVEDLKASGPRVDRIVGLKEGKFEKPELILESGDMIGSSATNLDTLARAYGYESELWSGHQIELYAGEGEFNKKPVEMVLIKPLSKAEGAAEEAAKPAKKKVVKSPPTKPDFDDEVTF
jgi:hypothetical protein